VAPSGLTGVLLVGGASSRFGSPKALARLRDETLAERAWRTLGEACDERIAVGKAELELPFDVLVEPQEPRAPITGVLAGLRAATNEAAVFLPVDCPLVTADLLRKLGEQRAVPQAGPLPGAYSQADVPELERRVAAGDYSLRGLNPRKVSVDPALLLDVDTPRDLALAAVAAWARARDDVRALVLFGSLARADSPADEWSDVDTIALVDDPERYLADDTWVAELGRPVLTFVEQTKLGGVFERRVLLEGGVDIDIVLAPAAAAERLPTGAPGVLRRGFLVLHDELGLAPRLEEAASAAPAEPPPTAAELDQVCADLWYHGLWTALECLDSHMRHRLLALLRWRAILDGRPVWQGARFVERWAGEPPGMLAATFGGYNELEVGRALWGMLDLAGRLEDDLRTRLGVPACDRSEAARLIADVQRR